MTLFAVIIGALCWSLTEYAIHRGLGHRPWRNPFSQEHMAHHRDPMYFPPLWKKVAAAALVLGVAGPPLALVAGHVGLAGLGSYLGAYLTYEIVHRRLHTHAPRGACGRWARRHHLHHHFRRPALNHGVTTPLWDVVFGTLEVPRSVQVPRRKALAWMLDPSGEVAAELRDQFELVGPG